ncbi:ABC transporter substrate-binding protein [Streptomyces sp. NPDC051940]|uniref:ABC transporter substrate-binding protein n=1 Tax=Streptomyces sp. NPDC051940 TaxID=3155675 RepID=UPI003434CC64
MRAQGHSGGRRGRTAAAAAAAAALLLGGCGLGGGDSSDKSGGKGGDSISVWFPGVNETEVDLVTHTIVPRFEKETGAKVKVTFVDWPDLSPKLNAAFAAGTAPDVFGHGPAAVADFVHNDRLEPLTDYVAKLGQGDQKDMETALPGGQVDGTQYLMPLSMQGNLLAYKEKDFEQAGLDPDKPPTTWEGVLDAAKKLTERDGDKVTHAGLLLPTSPFGLQQTFATLLGSAGGRQISEDGRKAAFNSPEGVRALTYFVGTYQGDGAVGDQLGVDYQSAPTEQQPLVTGDASITVMTPNVAQQVATAEPDLGLRVMPAPGFEGGRPEAFGGAGPGLMINKDSGAKDLAWKFIAYMLSAKTSVEYTEGVGAVPARASAATSDYVKNSPVVQQYMNNAPKFAPNPNIPAWTQVRDTLAKHLEQAVNGKVDPKEALDAAAAEVDGILAANG